MTRFIIYSASCTVHAGDQGTLGVCYWSGAVNPERVSAIICQAIGGKTPFIPSDVNKLKTEWKFVIINQSSSHGRSKKKNNELWRRP